MLDGGFIQHSKLPIQNFAACAECAFPRDHGVFNFGFWMMDWGEEKPNGEFWMLNGGLKTMLDFGWNSAFSI